MKRKKELILRTGDTIKVDRLERPQLLLNENGNPLVLYAACSIEDLNAKSDGSSFNVQIPLKKIKRTGNGRRIQTQPLVHQLSRSSK